MIRGFDYSYAQESNIPIDWGKVRDSGKADFVFGRVSYGANPDDNDGWTFERGHDECKRMGVPFGSYHFYRYSADLQAAVDNFIKASNGRLVTLLPMIDVEEQSFDENPGSDAARAHLAKTIELLQKATGVEHVIIYTNADTWQTYFANTDAFCGHPLWLAQAEDPAKSGLFGGWTSWVIWQDSTESIPGIEGAVDYDVLNGNDLGVIAR